MFRSAIYLFVTIRVLVCPLFCLGDGGVAHAIFQIRECSCEAVELVGLLSGECPSEDHDRRSPADEPCGGSCVCQILVEKSAKPLWTLSHLWQPLLVTPIEPGAVLAPVPGMSLAKSSLRPDLLSGLAIRLAFASLLL